MLYQIDEKIIRSDCLLILIRRFLVKSVLRPVLFTESLSVPIEFDIIHLPNMLKANPNCHFVNEGQFSVDPDFCEFV
jgi:hypothetical protein